MRSTGRCFLNAIAKSVLPEAVGPMINIAGGNTLDIEGLPNVHVGTVYQVPLPSVATR